MIVPTHIQVKGVEFVWLAKVINDTHERSASSLGNPIVEHHNVVIVIFNFQDSLSPGG